MEPEEETAKELRPGPNSLEHLMTHLPKHPDCYACQQAKMKKVHARRCKEHDGPAPVKFGDQVTADTLVSKNKQSRGECPDITLARKLATVAADMTHAILFLDEATELMFFAPDARRDVRAARKAFRNFAGPQQKIQQFYSDNAPELVRAAEDLEWIHPTSTPFRSTNNGRIERKIQHVEEGIRTVLSRSGMPVRTWPLAGDYFCNAHNFMPHNGVSSWERKNKRGPFPGKLIPYGARIDFLPPDPIKKLLPKFGTRAVPGVFLGWHMHPGSKWSRNYKVAALADLDLTNPGRSKRVRVFRVREILVPNEDKGYEFPCKEAADRAAGTIGKVAEEAAPYE